MKKLTLKGAGCVLFLLAFFILPINVYAVQKTGPVTFFINLNKEMFEPGADISVTIYGEQNYENMAQAVVSHDVLGQATNSDISVTNPVTDNQGASVQDIEPERFILPVSRIGTNIEINSNTIAVGDTYTIRISGKHPDGCNSASTTLTGSADKRVIIIYNAEWSVTQLACAPVQDQNNTPDNQEIQNKVLGLPEPTGATASPLPGMIK